MSDNKDKKYLVFEKFVCDSITNSISHTTDDMIFEWDPDVPLVVDENIELPQLALIENKTADCTQVYSTGNFTCVEVIFILKRRLGYYIFHTYIPTCMIVIMSWVSFWIKPEAAPARVALGVTSLLTLSTQHAKSQAALPPVSYLKAIDGFMSVCTVFVFMALMEYCLVNIVLGDTPPKPAAPPPPPEPTKPPESPKTENTEKLDHIENIFDDLTPPKLKNGRRKEKSDTDSECPWIPRLDSIILLSPIVAPQQPPPPSARKPSELPKLPELPKLTPAQQRLMTAINIDRFSRAFFPFLFAILNMIYWILFYEYL